MGFRDFVSSVAGGAEDAASKAKKVAKKGVDIAGTAAEKAQTGVSNALDAPASYYEQRGAAQAAKGNRVNAMIDSIGSGFFRDLQAGVDRPTSPKALGRTALGVAALVPAVRGAGLLGKGATALR